MVAGRRDPVPDGALPTADEEAPAEEAPPIAGIDERFVDLSELAAESPAESIARENEIVEVVALRLDYPERPADFSVDEQLAGLVDPDEIRRR